MELASGLHDLSDDRKAGHRSGLEARGALRQIDRIQDVLGDDEVGIAGPRSSEREAMKSVIAHRCSGGKASANEGIGVPLSPVRHRPEDILAGRSSPEGPALREVRRAYRMAEVVRQR